ncbi:MAG: polysaccharide biosynthesis protein, partial [Rhodospirillales bacterium]|nr:polysaccharide biosynthesis protein [Rhodospirillales bacterium]
MRPLSPGGGLLRYQFNRGHLVYLHDVVMAGLSFFAALYLRLGDEVWQRFDPQSLLMGIGLMVAIAAGVFWSLKLYNGVWRYASLNDLIAITKAVTLVILIFVPLLFALLRLDAMPRSVPFINWFVLMALLGGPRFLYRMAKDRQLNFKMERDGVRRIPVLLVGAGDAADLFIRAMAREGAPYQAVGMLAISDSRVGRAIQGIEVLGTPTDLDKAVAHLTERGQKPQRLILTRDDFDGALVGKLLEGAEALGLTLSRLPKMADLKDGVSERLELRPVAIEDLLGRPQTVLDRESMKALVAERVVLITGAGGSIGSELCRQVAAMGPLRLILLDHSEYALYTLDLELSESFPSVPCQARIGDVRDGARLDAILAETRPDIVFHAAALKHVPMIEATPIEGVLTNTIGTRNMAESCRKNAVKVMVTISTDKAVNPTNVLGASKRLAESYCQALDVYERDHDHGTRFMTVRFGNVLGSTGSVVPLFQRQLAAGGPLTVTHPQVTRYFMTIREAVELVLQASALGAKGESHRGKIFVLDMGLPVRILDLARQ